MCDHLRDALRQRGAREVAKVVSSAQIPARGCETCGAHGRLLFCLVCCHTSCWSGGHALNHASSSGHVLSCEVGRGVVYCAQCRDHVYDPELEGASATTRASTSHKSNDTVDEHSVHHSHATPCSEAQGHAGLRGMHNLGNTCFMSVVLQALVHNPLLRNYFLFDKHNHDRCPRSSEETKSGQGAGSASNGNNHSHSHSNGTSSGSGTEKKVCLGCDLDALYGEVFSGSKAPFTPHQFLYSMWRYADHLAGYAQQDAHEFLISLLDGIHTACAGTPTGDCSCVIHRIFGGKLRSEVLCGGCGSRSTTVEPMFDFSLDLRHSQAQQTPQPPGDMTLDQCLRRFTRAERLSAFRCDKCMSPQDATKQLSIDTLPPVLCFHLKRFEHEWVTNRLVSSKIDLPVLFPADHLNLTPFLSTTVSAALRSAQPSHQTPSQGQTIQPMTTEAPLYQLFAVIVHHGAMDSGHYTCYVRRRDQWYKCDDTCVSLATAEDVLNSQAYLLFYIRHKLPSEATIA